MRICPSVSIIATTLPKIAAELASHCSASAHRRQSNPQAVRRFRPALLRRFVAEWDPARIERRKVTRWTIDAAAAQRFSRGMISRAMISICSLWYL
jgi:hypothetical protein